MAERKYKHPQVNLRLPEELKEKVAKLAEKNGRSANAEMVMAIQFWVGDYLQAQLDDVDDGSPNEFMNAPKVKEIHNRLMREFLSEIKKNKTEIVKQISKKEAEEMGFFDDEFDRGIDTDIESFK